MLDNKSLQIQLIKNLYAKYHQEITPIDGVYLKAKFSGLSDLISIELKERPYSEKMLLSDLQFVNKSLEITSNLNDNKVNKEILATLQQESILLENIVDFTKENPNIYEKINNHINAIDIIKLGDLEIKSNRIFRKIELSCSTNSSVPKIVEDYKLAQIELLNKINQANKVFLLEIVKTQSTEAKEALIKIILGKIISDPLGSLVLLKVFKA